MVADSCALPLLATRGGFSMNFPPKVKCVGAFCILTAAKPQPHVWMYKSGGRLQVMALPEKAVDSYVSCRRKFM